MCRFGRVASITLAVRSRREVISMRGRRRYSGRRSFSRRRRGRVRRSVGRIRIGYRM